jgi:hypothetical protein
MKLLKWIKSLFNSKPVSYQHWHVEAFVESKRPKTNAEVEFWIRHYEQNHMAQRGWAAQ